MISSYERSTTYDATSSAMRSNAFEDPSTVAVPVTLAFGERDRLVRPVRVEGARTIVMSDCGHIPMWDNPHLVLAIIRETVRDPASELA
jgi:pimeloyl-ACP methyl ester carboxylesterase